MTILNELLSAGAVVVSRRRSRAGRQAAAQILAELIAEVYAAEPENHVEGIAEALMHRSDPGSNDADKNRGDSQ